MSDNHKYATYTTERYTAELDAKTYIERFRRADYFLKLCQQCGNYGRRFGCPPFDHDPLTVLQRYDRVQIIGVKVTPYDKTLPLCEPPAHTSSCNYAVVPHRHVQPLSPMRCARAPQPFSLPSAALCFQHRAGMMNSMGQNMQGAMNTPPPIPNVQYHISVNGSQAGPFNM